jgi:hypothetical protein
MAAILTRVSHIQTVHPRRGEPDWTMGLRQHEAELWARVRQHGVQRREHFSSRATYILGDSINWLSDLPPNSIHAIVTDPPYLEKAEKAAARVATAADAIPIEET